jgi:hypothetical protein
MDLIGRYLRAYTVHTSYNIGDFGRSYLENQMRDFPTDLVGRVERDCGVYALTVAYEVFRTAREATPRLPVEFRLFAMPEHVTLVIFDRSQNNYYIVNNDRVSPPRQGDIMEDVARAYAPIPGRRNLVTPSMEFELGSTALSNSQFRSRAWSRYLDGASWGIHVPPPQPGDTSAPAELRERAYREFYAAQRFYDESTPELHELVDNLVAAIANLSPADRLARLRTDIPTLSRLAADVGLAFERAGPFAQLDTARPDAALLPRLRTAQRFLFLSDRPGRPTALVRAAMALLHFAHEGGTLSPVEQAIIALCDRVPAFHATLDTYRQHGFPAEF